MPAYAHDYLFRPRAEDVDTLARHLGRLGDAMAAVPGFAGADILIDRAGGAVHYVEKWRDRAARDAAGPHMPKAILREVMALSPDGMVDTALEWQAATAHG